MPTRFAILLALIASPVFAESKTDPVDQLVVEVRTHLDSALTAAIAAEAARLEAQRAGDQPQTVRASLARARDSFVAMEDGLLETRRRLMRLSETLLGRGQVVVASSVDRMRRQLESVRRPGLHGLLRRPSASLRALGGRLELIERRIAREG